MVAFLLLTLTTRLCDCVSIIMVVGGGVVLGETSSNYCVVVCCVHLRTKAFGVLSQ